MKAAVIFLVLLVGLLVLCGCARDVPSEQIVEASERVYYEFGVAPWNGGTPTLHVKGKSSHYDYLYNLSEAGYFYRSGDHTRICYELRGANNCRSVPVPFEEILDYMR